MAPELSDNFEDLFAQVIAPEYASEVEGEFFELFTDQAQIELGDGKVWGKRYERAVGYITAHLIAMSKRASGMGGNAATGQLLKTKVGDLERQFASNGSDKNSDSYSLTTYGQEFIRLRKQVLKGPIFVSC